MESQDTALMEQMRSIVQTGLVFQGTQNVLMDYNVLQVIFGGFAAQVIIEIKRSDFHH